MLFSSSRSALIAGLLLALPFGPDQPARAAARRGAGVLRRHGGRHRHHAGRCADRAVRGARRQRRHRRHPGVPRRHPAPGRAGAAGRRHQALFRAEEHHHPCRGGQGLACATTPGTSRPCSCSPSPTRRGAGAAGDLRRGRARSWRWRPCSTPSPWWRRSWAAASSTGSWCRSASPSSATASTRCSSGRINALAGLILIGFGVLLIAEIVLRWMVLWGCGAAVPVGWVSPTELQGRK